MELARRVAQVETENKKLKATTDGVAQSRQGAFGAGAVRELEGFATRLLSVTAAIDAIKQAFQFAREEEEKALGTLRQFTNEAIRLNQIATSPQDLAALRQQRDYLVAKYGADPSQVMKLQFAARSEGFERSVEYLTSLNQVFTDLEVAASVAGQVPQLFPGRGLTPEQVVDMTFVGARESRLDFEALGRAIPSIAEGGALAGATPAETIAVGSVMAARFKSGQSAADRAKAFATKAGIDERLRGKGFLGAFVALRDEFTPEERKKFLGESQELNVFYQTMSEEFERVVERRKKIEDAQAKAGTPESATYQARMRAEADPEFAAVKRLEQAERRREVERMQQEGVEAAERAAAVEDLMTAMGRADAGRLPRWTAWTAAQATRLFGGSREQIISVGAGFADAFSADTAGALAPRVHRAIRDIETDPTKELAQSMQRHTQAIEQNTRALERSTSAPAPSSRAAALAEATSQRE